jgi:hypothetical protein
VPKDLLAEQDDTVKLARSDVERQVREYRARLQREAKGNGA